MTAVQEAAIVGLAIGSGRAEDLAAWWRALSCPPAGLAQPDPEAEPGPDLAERLAAGALEDAGLEEPRPGETEIDRAEGLAGLVRIMEELRPGAIGVIVDVGAGKGGAAVAVQNLARARADGRRIYAVIRGFGRADELARSVGSALRTAGVDAERITYLEINPGPPNKDDLAALAGIWPPRRDEPPRCGLGRPEPGQSALAGLVKTALAVYHRLLPPGAATEGDPSLDSTPFYPIAEVRPWFRGRNDLRRAVVGAVEEGRHYHFVLEEDPNHAGLGAAWPSELVVVSADDRAGLLAVMESLKARLQDEAETPLDRLAYTLARRPAGRHRLAVVARNAADLAAKLEAAASKLGSPDKTRLQTRTGITFNQLDEDQDPDRSVLLFPGQGSQTVNMLAGLCLHFPLVRSWFESLDGVFAGESGPTPTELLFPPPAELSEAASCRVAEYLRSMEGGAPGAFVACLALNDLLTRLGFRPEAMVGHSNGENAALIAAGVLRLDRDGIFRLIRRLSAKAEKPEEGLEPVRGVTAAVSLPDKGVLAEILAPWSGRAFWAMDNCPHQVVLFGDREAMDDILQALRRLGAITMVLPFDRAFHTPLFAPQAEALREVYDSIEAGSGHTPVYSCHTAGRFPEEPAAIRQLAAAQWTGRVRFQETMEALYSQGFRTFVEAGPSNTLTTFVDDIFRGRKHTAAACCVEGRPDLGQFQELVGRLFALGLIGSVTALFEGRGLRPIPLEKDEQAAPAAPGPSPSRQAREAIIQGHFGLMNEFLASQERVLARIGAALGSAGARRTGPAPAADGDPAGRWPLLGAVVEETPTRLAARRRLNVAEDVFLLDHCLGRRFPGRSDELHPLPVLPFAFSLEMLAQAASRLGGGRPVVGVENVRGHRWIALDRGVLELGLEAELESAGDRVQVRMFELDPERPEQKSLVFEGRVALAAGYPDPPPPAGLTPRPQQPPKWSAKDFYRYCLFHGPRLQGVRRLVAHGPDGLEAELAEPGGLDFFNRSRRVVWQTSPVLIDCAGQLVGYWLVEQFSREFFGVFPYFIRSLHQFGPPPAPGAVLECRAAMRFEPPEVEADFDFIDSSGRLVFRLEGMRGRVFDFPQAYLNCLYWPETGVELSRPWLEESGLIVQRLDDLTEDLLETSFGIWKRALAHVTLGPRERELWHDLPERGPRRTQWLLGRVAAKDAVRRWARAELGLALEPTGVEVLPDDSGRPVIACAGLEGVASLPSLSICHSGLTAAAALDPSGKGIGLDLESLEGREVGEWLERAFHDDELALVAPDDRRALLGLWCAKEAAAKAGGQGLEGAPLAWRIEDGSPEHGRVVVSRGGRRWLVRMWYDGPEAAALCWEGWPPRLT